MRLGTSARSMLMTEESLDKIKQKINDDAYFDIDRIKRDMKYRCTLIDAVRLVGKHYGKLGKDEPSDASLLNADKFTVNMQCSPYWDTVKDTEFERDYRNKLNYFMIIDFDKLCIDIPCIKFDKQQFRKIATPGGIEFEAHRIGIENGNSNSPKDIEKAKLLTADIICEMIITLVDRSNCILADVIKTWKEYKKQLEIRTLAYADDTLKNVVGSSEKIRQYIEACREVDKKYKAEVFYPTKESIIEDHDDFFDKLRDKLVE